MAVNVIKPSIYIILFRTVIYFSLIRWLCNTKFFIWKKQENIFPIFAYRAVAKMESRGGIVLCNIHLPH